MTGQIEDKLHSAAPTVAIEAAAGCGKTTLAAKFARDAAERLTSGKVLLLSHTHAACGEFQRKCGHGLSGKVEVETCDSFCLKAIANYPKPLNLPAPIDKQLERPDGIEFADLSGKACELFARSPTIAKAIARFYPIIVLDEHQDASTTQHRAVQLLQDIGGSRLRIFGDPMQAIHLGSEKDHVADWSAIWASADDKGTLDKPHRWSDAPDLGEWITSCRATLKAGNPISFRDAPVEVSVSTHRALAGRGKFIDARSAGQMIRQFLDGASTTSAALAFLGDMARTIAQLGYWRAPLNEGAQLEELNALILGMEEQAGNPQGLASNFLHFLSVIGAGLPDQEKQALSSRCKDSIHADRAGAKQLSWLELLKPIYEHPDHRGVASAMLAICGSPPIGYTIRLKDHAWALCSLARSDDPRALQSSLGRIRRLRSRPPHLISTIHKAKGLDFDHVLLCPVDKHQYPPGALGARLLYVSLSRARRGLRVVVETKTPTPHVAGCDNFI